MQQPRHVSLKTKFQILGSGSGSYVTIGAFGAVVSSVILMPVSWLVIQGLGERDYTNAIQYDNALEFFNITRFFFVIGVPLLIPGLLRLRKYIRLYRYGTIVEATLVSVLPLPLLPVALGKIYAMLADVTQQSTRPMRVRIAYTHKTSSGRVVEDSAITDETVTNKMRLGDVVPIFVSVEDENLSCLVPPAKS